MTNSNSISLREVDRVEITTLIDNYVDLMLQDTPIVKRPPLSRGEEIPRETLAAEHGLSLLVTTYRDSEKHSVLLDAGYNKNSVLHNIDQLEIDIQSVEAIILSHAHMDHAGALYSILDRIPKPIPLVVHPDIFSFPRFLEDKKGNRLYFPKTFIKDDVAPDDFTLVESKSPTLIAHDTIAVTGEVERTTDFEKGLPNAYMEADGRIVQDPIPDDQSLIVQLKDKRLVLITGCCHAGIINTIRFARKLTNIEKVYGVFGGFHLSGAFFETVIEKTVDELKEIHPEVIVPMHCTGWNAVKKLADSLSDAFIINSVGSKFVLS
jgi:7,8-dihydropterin-6-yl-methyl-4-(beta-D-ribofuranosyl)aminobenzene 5'-phosphate synthase